MKQVTHSDNLCTVWSEWAVNEGGGDIEVSLTEEDAIKYGVLRPFGNG